MLSYVEGLSSFKLANKSAGLLRGYDVLPLYLAPYAPHRCTHIYTRIHRTTVGVVDFFYCFFFLTHHATLFARHRALAPPSRLQVARNSLQPSPYPYLNVRPVERGAKISARLPDDSTASSPFISLPLFFFCVLFSPPERIFLCRISLPSFFIALTFILCLTLSYFTLNPILFLQRRFSILRVLWVNDNEEIFMNGNK